MLIGGKSFTCQFVWCATIQISLWLGSYLSCRVWEKWLWHMNDIYSCIHPAIPYTKIFKVWVMPDSPPICHNKPPSWWNIVILCAQIETVKCIAVCGAQCIICVYQQFWSKVLSTFLWKFYLTVLSTVLSDSLVNIFVLQFCQKFCLRVLLDNSVWQFCQHFVKSFIWQFCWIVLSTVLFDSFVGHFCQQFCLTVLLAHDHLWHFT